MKITLSSKRHESGWIAGLLIGCLALVVGGILVYKLYQLADRITQPNGGTNSVPVIGITNGFTQAESMSEITNVVGQGLAQGGNVTQPCEFLFFYTAMATNVVVERSTDLRKWVPIQTNYSEIGDTVLVYDADAPCDRGFYRLCLP